MAGQGLGRCIGGIIEEANDVAGGEESAQCRIWNASRLFGHLMNAIGHEQTPPAARLIFCNSNISVFQHPADRQCNEG
jgi:hypothetical protein